jgi:ubiquinone/menaquinone biosynthesis C-methylase UbiE
MLKKTFLYWTRRMGLMHGFDRAFFFVNRLRFYFKNRQFRASHPDFALPPDYMLYEAYRMDYAHYFEDGKNTAEWLISEVSSYQHHETSIILDWGCGPARVVRHLRRLLPAASLHATDYNSETIKWCQEQIPGINFKQNGLVPPLDYQDNFFDLVYGLSVFTHLSEQNHYLWMEELYRVMKPGGIFLVTTHGKSFKEKLTDGELAIFMQGKLVVRDRVKEGHRSFSAYQPEAFIHSLISNRFQVLKYTFGKVEDWGPAQDTWILRKI